MPSSRRESRGAQQRSDYLEPDPALNLNFVVRLNGNGEQELSTVPVPPIPEELRAWVKAGEELPLARRLLE